MPPPSDSPSGLPPAHPKLADALLKQYELLEQRRRQFGSEFMQSSGFFFVAIAGLVGLLGKSHDTLFRVVLVYAALMFAVVTFLAYRLGQRQDDCEREMALIEEKLRSECEIAVISFPRGAAKFGARKVIIATLALFAVSLFAVAIFWWKKA